MEAGNTSQIGSQIYLHVLVKQRKKSNEGDTILYKAKLSFSMMLVLRNMWNRRMEASEALNKGNCNNVICSDFRHQTGSRHLFSNFENLFTPQTKYTYMYGIIVVVSVWVFCIDTTM